MFEMANLTRDPQKDRFINIFEKSETIHTETSPIPIPPNTAPLPQIRVSR